MRPIWANVLYRDSGAVAAHVAAVYAVRYSHAGCIKLLHRLGFEYKRPKGLPAQADGAKQAEFIEAYEDLLNGLADDEAVHFVDAVHPEYQSRPTQGWIEKGDKLALKRISGRWRCNLHGALNLETFHCPLVQAERSTPPRPSLSSRSWRPTIPAKGTSTSSSTTPATATPAWSENAWRDRVAASN